MKREWGGRSKVGLSDVLNQAIKCMGKDKALNWWMTPQDLADGMEPFKYCQEKSPNKLLSRLYKYYDY